MHIALWRRLRLPLPLTALHCGGDRAGQADASGDHFVALTTRRGRVHHQVDAISRRKARRQVRAAFCPDHLARNLHPRVRKDKAATRQ